MRLLTRDELAAVVGHELGHFHGKDIKYSMKFSPVYQGLGQALGVLDSDDGEGISGIAKLPAFAILSLAYELFARNERAISRNRELEADKVGALVSSASALGIALAKVAVFAPLWNYVRQQNVNRLESGTVIVNLVETFEDSARFDISRSAIKDVLHDVLKIRLAHPTDSHPTVKERYASLGFNPSQLTMEKLVTFTSDARSMLGNAEEIEQALTLDEHKLIVALGLAQPPEEPSDESTLFVNAMYMLAAHVVAADGLIAQEEVAQAEQIGAQLFEKFDPLEFRGVCRRHAVLPDLQELVRTLNEVLGEEQKRTLIDYLEAIAAADGEVSEIERNLIETVRVAWACPVKHAASAT